MTVLLRKPPASAIPLRAVDRRGLPEALRRADAATRPWLEATGVPAAEHGHALVPGAGGELAEVWIGVADPAGPQVLAALESQHGERAYNL